MPQKRARGLIDVFEEKHDFEESIIPPSESDEGSTGNLAPESTPLRLAASNRVLDTEERESTGYPEESDQSTHTHVEPTNIVHSQTLSGNEASSSGYDPSE
jgi:hypothetical protein